MSRAALALAAALLAAPLARYAALHSNLLDLGVFQNLLYRVGSLGEWPLAFTGHATPVALLYAPLYAALPAAFAPYALLASQALLLLTPAPWLARRFGAFAALAYVAYVPVWINAHFDFHFDHLAVPLMLGFCAALSRGRVAWATASALGLLLVKEPFALQVVACGALLAWAAFFPRSLWEEPAAQPARGALLAGAAVLASAGLAWFFVAMRYVLPYFAPESWPGPLGGEAFGWLGRTPGEIAVAALTRPHDVLAEVFSTPGRLAYLGVVFGTLAFVPLLRPAWLIPAVPPLAIALLSRLPNYHDYNTHYTAGLVVPVMFAFVHALPRARRLWSRALAALRAPAPRLDPVLLAWILGAHVLLSPSPVSRLFWSEKVWSYSWRGYVPTERDAMIKDALASHVPAAAEVAVATQNTLNWHTLAHRRLALPFPFGVAEPVATRAPGARTLEGFMRFVAGEAVPRGGESPRYVDYVVVDLGRPLFVGDRGCEWIHGACRDPAVQSRFLAALAHARAHADTVFERDGFMILRRRP